MGYFRFRRSRSLIPGVRMNLSKSGVSWSFGPRGAHYTIGPRGQRTTVGIPGTGMSYTTYSHGHARAAAHRRSAGGSTAATPGLVMRPAPREPWLPSTKLAVGAGMVIGGLLLMVLVVYLGAACALVGAAIAFVGWRQRTQPMWQVRTLLRRMRAHPSDADSLAAAALAIDADNPEALAAVADLRLGEHRWQEAAETYERYLTHAPDDIAAVGHCGTAWCNAIQPDRAIPLLIRARDDARLDDESRASLNAALGMAYLHKQQPDQALVVIGAQPLTAHSLSPGQLQCLFVRAVAHYRAGQKSRGIADLDRLARLEPGFGEMEQTRQQMLLGTFV